MKDMNGIEIVLYKSNDENSSIVYAVVASE